MINFLHGSIAYLGPQMATLMVGGVGYEVKLPDEKVFTEGQEVKMHIYTHWNQDNGPSLFGFNNVLDKEIFMLIVGCTGIGPKIGLAALAHMTAGQFIALVVEGDAKGLSAVNGIGIKKAENMIVQLRRKVEKLVDSGINLGGDGSVAQDMSKVTQVLTSLSYSRPEISAALEYVKKHEDLSQLSFDGLLRKALGYLSKQI